MSDKVKACIVCGPIPHGERSYRFKESEWLCNKHYLRLKKFGDPFKRTPKDPNEIVVYDDHAEIVLYDKDSNETARTRISLDKVDKAKQHKWASTFRRGKISYVVTSINNVVYKLHQVLFDIPEGMVADHKDTDVLNNMNDNIRFCTQKQNSRNIMARKNNDTGVAGVYWNAANGKWRARIKVDRKAIDLGCFVDFAEAVRARLRAEIEYYGEYAPQAHRLEFQKYFEGD